MCFMAMTRNCSECKIPYRIKMYEREKTAIPMNLPPREYEAEIKRLARKWRV